MLTQFLFDCSHQFFSQQLPTSKIFVEFELPHKVIYRVFVHQCGDSLTPGRWVAKTSRTQRCCAQLPWQPTLLTTGSDTWQIVLTAGANPAVRAALPAKQATGR
jgi:hypothetical protein